MGLYDGRVAGYAWGYDKGTENDESAFILMHAEDAHVEVDISVSGDVADLLWAAFVALQPDDVPNESPKEADDES